jgi:poly(ADP-ribose) glycohydrolase
MWLSTKITFYFMFVRDIWGRKWCHLVAMDAIFFRDKSSQYQMKNVERELLKAYTSFRPLGHGPDHEFGIATGNWGCGAFNGDRQLKGTNC